MLLVLSSIQTASSYVAIDQSAKIVLNQMSYI